MRVSILLAHPNPQSFSHAVASAASDELGRLGHEVLWHDLYAESFDPLLTTPELGRDPVLPPLVARHCRELVAVDGIVIVHPNWWGQPPAILKGWIDRVVRPEVAYKFVAGDGGEGVPVGLLRMKRAIVLNTSNTDAAREVAVFGDPLEGLWRGCVFGLCGVPGVVRETFSVVITSTVKQREAWLERTRALIRQSFPVTE